MARFSFADHEPNLDLGPDDRQSLHAIADRSIRAGLEGQGPVIPPPDNLAPPLRQRRGAFVTLHVRGELNGCIGTIEPVEAVGAAVGRLAWESAFADPRLPALTERDYADLSVKISVLSPLEPMPAESEDAVLRWLRPGTDGLLIAWGRRRATFLPAVWDTLADPRAFLDHLEMKAGLPPRSWPEGMAAFRYTSTEF